MKVKFLPDGQEFEIKPNQTILSLAQENGIHIQSVCKGIPSCSECRVNIAEGEYNLLPPSETELSLIGTAFFVDQRRLSCQLRCFGDVVVDLTAQNEKAKEAVSSKKPRGYGPQKDASESSAVMGSIMLDEEEQSRADVNERTVNIELAAEETRKELARIKSKRSGGGERDSSNRNRNRNQKNSKSGGARNASAPKSEVKSSDNENEANKKKPRRRRQRKKPAK